MRASNYRRKIKINKKLLLWILSAAAGITMGMMIFFFAFFKVEHVEVRGNTVYSDDEVKRMVLNGVFADNSVLAPMFCSQSKVKDVFFVDSISVTQLTRDTIVISVREKKPVGCIHFLDSYIYFDRNGVFVEGSVLRDEKIPFFNGIKVSKVVEDEKLPIKGSNVLTTAVTLSTIFQKEETLPDFVQFDDNSQIRLIYGKITVMLGEDKYLEDKMARAIAILDLINGKKGILHLESVTDSNKNVTFEPDAEEIAVENWTGGYDEYGNYTETGEYDEDGNYVGPMPKTELKYALQAWPGGYDAAGRFTGTGEYDQHGNKVGKAPTQADLDARGDWTGGYTQDGVFTGTGEYDRSGNYVGAKSDKKKEKEKKTGQDGEEDEKAEDKALSEALENALAQWTGGYDENGEYTGDGEYDEYGNYIGQKPTRESLKESGDYLAYLPSSDEGASSAQEKTEDEEEQSFDDENEITVEEEEQGSEGEGNDGSAEDGSDGSSEDDSQDEETWYDQDQEGQEDWENTDYEEYSEEEYGY